MTEPFRARIPYESLDPLTIGTTEDEAKVYREELELEIPMRNLLAAIYPDEPPAVPDTTAEARRALAEPVAGKSLAQLLEGGRSITVVIDNQFRPTPASKILPAVLDEIERAETTKATVITGNGKVFPLSESDIEQKVGRENLARMERLGIPLLQNDPLNYDAYAYLGVTSRGTPAYVHKSVVEHDVVITIGQAQANHWGYGGGGKLIMPGVCADITIEANHANFTMSPQTHYGALAGPMRSDIDEIATMAGLTATLDVLLDTRGKVIEMKFGSHPVSHRRAIERFNEIYAFDNPVTEHGPADIAICGVFAPTDHLFFHTGWGCMSADYVVRDGGTIIYTSPSPGVKTEAGEFPGLALMDLMKPYMPPSREGHERMLRDIHAREIQMWAGCIWAPIYDVMVRKHLTLVTLEENLEMAADIGIDATTSLDEAFEAAMRRHGPDAKVVILPFARYQLPKTLIQLDAQPLRFPQEALT
ncbi:transcriptional regulator [Saccharopolyspora subtropica]|uniref:Nickel-dependent lactate racemase n=1 Tax=Saccharopolyspora thermophila TaxID=89367 RepID=A0A917K422_9PSEU|nr:lactate racemase domain-containing protein [Saccharopolyspora subtropica]GGI96423.1 transcriptional regulator [Saccharopolyspora subtropica]